MGLYALLGRRSRPPTIPTDRIIPLRYFDDQRYLRPCHDFTLRFDDVLDAPKLEAALDRLMEIGNWGQLGARLRQNDDDRLEYHIPAQYDKMTRPAFVFTTTEHRMSINEHPLGSQLPKTSQDQPVLYPSCAHFAPLVCHPDGPRQLADWIYTDRPQLHIHLVLFQDATLLTLNFIHTLTDAISRINFFRAWLAVLNGREEEVPQFYPFDHDPLHALGVNAQAETYSNFSRLVSGLALVLWGLRFLFERALWFRKEEEHLIRLPKACVKRIAETARQELAAAAPTSPDGAEKRPFLSENDVLIAWWVRMMVIALKPASNRTVVAMNVFNVWGLFPEWFPDGGAGFIGNAFFCSYSLHRASRILQDTNLAYVASKNRQALVEHRTKAQVQAMAAIQRTSPLKAAPLVGDSSMLFLSCTNHQKAGLFELDFSSAVVAPGTPLSKRPHALGRPSCINKIEHHPSYLSRDVLRIFGKDAGGDWWLAFKTRRGAWPEIRRQLMLLETEKKG
ncbi:hypothetical protein BJX68DRAFT_257301 [Aspergillus pseudodeflectus]|uniref:LysR family regulatory protein n=1 Tax=Aspergillus pseudodeflectus TaxID=176178 RepID=A0ABR4JVN5_9EURO